MTDSKEVERKNKKLSDEEVFYNDCVIIKIPSDNFIDLTQESSIYKEDDMINYINDNSNDLSKEGRNLFIEEDNDNKEKELNNNKEKVNNNKEEYNCCCPIFLSSIFGMK